MADLPAVLADLPAVLADLAAESADLDALVCGLSGWDAPTPADGWTIKHQIAHLVWTDDVALQAATDPAAFQAVLDDAAQDPAGFVDRAAQAGTLVETTELLLRWRQGRGELARSLADLPGGTKLPWFGPPMSAISMATARLMETWAHGQDIADALGVTRTATDRLRHVAHLGWRTRAFAYAVNRRQAPDSEIAVVLTGPSGQTWAFGPAEAAQRVTGAALDFCLLVTQRRHRSELALVADGGDADEWLDIAQAFAGPPGRGREPA